MPTVTYPAGGWLPRGAQFSWQHSDQGRDFVTNWNGVIQAPGDFEVVNVGSNSAFPNGFGPAYPWVKILSGKWAGSTFYLGHTTSAVNVGDRGGFGHVLSHANQGHPSQIGIPVPGDGGWVELGQVQDNGTLGPYSDTGHWYDHLFDPLVIVTPDPALHFGDSGWRVIGLTANLAACGWLPHMQWKFDRNVHGAVVAFKKFHKIKLGVPDGGIVDKATDGAIKAAADHCKKTKHKEHS